MFFGINNLIVNVSEISTIKKCSDSRIEICMNNEMNFIIESIRVHPEQPSISVSQEIIWLIDNARKLKQLNDNSIENNNIGIRYGKIGKPLYEYESF